MGVGKSLKFFVAYLLLMPVYAHAYYDDGFSNETYAEKVQTRWMEKLPSDRKWMQLSLPGTHDSGANQGGLIVETQRTTIAEQLKAGIRWLDIRVKWEEDKFPIYHGPISQGKDLKEVLNQVKTFLEQNPSESITMRLSQEGESGRHSWRTFGETFEKQYRSQYSSLFWMRNVQGSRDPTLGEIRGKVYLLYDFPPYWVAASAVPGSYYRDCDTQDQYQMGSISELYNKWEAVKKQIERANSRSGGYNCYINYLSASGGVFPYFVAGGRVIRSTWSDRMSTGVTTWGWNANLWPDFPRVGCMWSWCTIVYQGINTLTKNYINNRSYIKYVGAIPADYPGPGLIQSVINVNYR